MTTAVRTSEARERLLRTASALFYAEGLRAVGVDRVVAEASVTRATFYRHFPGKEDLVVAYLRGVDRAVRERAGDLPADPADAGAAAAWLEHLTASVGEELCGPGFRGCAFLNAATEHPDPASPVRAAVAEHRRWLRDAVTEAFRRTGHPDPAAAAVRWTVLRDGAVVAGQLAGPGDADGTGDARGALRAGLTALLAEARGPG